MINVESFLPLEEKNLFFAEIKDKAIKYALQLGATDAYVIISETNGLSVSSRKNDIENVEKYNERGIDLTVYIGKASGSASSSDFSNDAIYRTVKSAIHIAKNIAIDEYSGLPDKDMLATEFPDFKVCHALNLSLNDMINFTLLAEQTALSVDPKIVNTEGSSFDAQNVQFLIGNTLGFSGYKAYSNYTISSVPIAALNNNMQRDYWYESNCNPNKLMSADKLGEIAAKRSLSRLSAKRIPTNFYPVIFEAPVALSLLSALSHAINGSNLYRKASFLQNHLGKKIFSDFIDIVDDPYIIGQIGSSSFDVEGVRTKTRNIVKSGTLEGYFLSNYSAKKLGMISTGNAGGFHNLLIKSNKDELTYSFSDLLKKMNRGLLVTELIGHGTNYVTGDYSRGAFGYWVENGEILYPVEEITIAGNLISMFKDIIAIGSDIIIRDNKMSGSILLEKMSVAGS
ncbi:Metalloprotease PmbA [Candidatus Kinetoplastibacterium sorsogonicusi]|uniref:Metalloprotease PmbA n=1 Tax=Candidatus Kinetoplastidibacterium kentomonadis TaxID=1576550 RepID=A0A3Q8EX87_9PROT|nr:metalloprotease PmbA [Candidatus Kinetoplastibacterium sorsogonicusi]AWD32691.1 Metalloprotease PmbA [Candidatus Kinetoplastibacterium sorsogonicusi]